MIYLAAALLFVTGLAHSYLGERYILTRLFKRENLPKLFGGTTFTINTIRFAWHVTSVAWWGFAYLILLAGQGSLTPSRALRTIAITALVTGLFPVIFTRGRHLSWVVFFTVAVLLFLS